MKINLILSIKRELHHALPISPSRQKACEKALKIIYCSQPFSFPLFPTLAIEARKKKVFLVRGRKGSKTFRKPANSHAWLIERFQIVNSQKYRFVPVFVFHLRLFARHAQSFSLEGLSRANETRRGREKNISSIRVYQDFAFLNKREKKST
jgi:hypothetical protein